MSDTDHEPTDERLAELMVKVVDRVATPAEREELMARVVADPVLRAELEDQQAFKAVTDGWMSRLEADLAVDRDRTNPGRRLERGLGVGLILLGLAVLWGWGWAEVLMDPSAPLPLRFGIGALAAGCLMVLFHVVRVRWFSGDRDPYSEVIR
jgi:ferric-dicitrate binding protein FerR (iron transport regulator)